MGMRARTPAAPPEPPGPLHELREYLAESRQHLDRIARAIKDSGSPGVLETATVTIPASGVLDRSYRIPYAAVAVVNLSVSSGVIVTSAGPQGAAPGGGQGQMNIAPGAALTQNMSGQAITFYATAGTKIIYSVLVNRVQPQASPIGQVTMGYPAVSVLAQGAVTAPVAAQQIAVTAALGTGLYEVSVLAYLSGTPAAGDADNIALLNGAVQAGVIPLIPAEAVMPAWTVRLRGAGLPLAVAAIGAGTAAAGYHAAIIATQTGP